jgi:hypothetical protein
MQIVYRGNFLLSMDICPKCNQTTLEKKVWKLPYRYNNPSVEASLRKFNLNCIIEYKCTNCNYIYKG